MSKNTKPQTSGDQAGAAPAGGASEGTHVVDHAALLAQLAAAVAACERMQAAVQSLAIQASDSASSAEKSAAAAKELLAEAIDGHNAVIAAIGAADARADSALDAAAPALSAMTLAEACGLVGVAESDALGFKDHGTHVVVVTVAGKKLSTAD